MWSVQVGVWTCGQIISAKFVLDLSLWSHKQQSSESTVLNLLLIHTSFIGVKLDLPPVKPKNKVKGERLTSRYVLVAAFPLNEVLNCTK